MRRITGAPRPSGLRLVWTVLFLSLSSGAAPVAPLQAAKVVNLSPVQMFDMADRAKAAGRFDAAAAIYTALANDPDIEIRSEARFRKGMMLAERKHYADAAVEFRAILDEKPDALRVRLELARMLAVMGHDGEARGQLRQAESGHLPIDVTATVDQFSRALQSRKTFGGSFEVSAAPDSNINRATEARTLDTIIAPLTLSRDARARSGLGLETSGQVFARIAIAPHVSLLPRLSESGNIYRTSDFNDISASALIGLEYVAGADRWTPSIGETWRWYGGKGYARTENASVAWLHPAGRTTQITVNLSASHADYLRDDLETGAIYDADVQIDHALGARGGISVSEEITRQTARDAGFATWAGGVTLLGWREMGRFTTFVSIGGRRTVGDERLFLFPDRRKDWLLTARAGVTIRKMTLGGFAPIVRVGIDQNSSTLGLYAYRRVFTNIGIVRAF